MESKTGILRIAMAWPKMFEKLLASIPDKEQLKGYAAILTFTVLVAGTFPLGAAAISNIEPAALVAARLLLATVVFAVFLIIRHRNTAVLKPPPKFWRFLIFGGLLGFHFFSQFTALETSDPVSVGFIFTLVPLFSGIFAWLIVEQRLNIREIGGILIAATGTALLIFDGKLSNLFELNLGQGEILFLWGVAAYGLYSALVKYLSQGEAVDQFAFWTTVGAALIVIPLSLQSVKQVDWWGLAEADWLIIGYLAIVTTVITFMLTQYALIRISAAKVTAMGYLVPLFVVVFEVASGVTQVNPYVAPASLLTVSGLVIMLLVKQQD